MVGGNFTSSAPTGAIMTRKIAAKAAGVSAVIDRRIMDRPPLVSPSETLFVERSMSSRHHHGNACADASHQVSSRHRLRTCEALGFHDRDELSFGEHRVEVDQ